MRKRRPFAVISGKQKKKSSGEKIVYILLMLALGLLVLQVTYSLGRSVFASLFVDTVTSENSVLEHTVSASGVLVRDEHVVAAPLTGTLHWLVPQGERVPLGATVATITTAGGIQQKVTAPVPGMLIKQLDGLEGELQPKALADIRPEKINDVKPQQAESGEDVQQGSIIFKLVDNYTWYFVAGMSRQEYNDFREFSASARLRFSFAPKEEVRSQSAKLSETDETVTVAFTLQQDIDGGFTERFAEADVIMRGTSGIVLPSSALLLRGDETGVYVVEKSVVRYRSVDVLDVAGDQVVVDGLRPGFPIITNPGLVREGQRL
ncbi:HlyD family efflux transporter periplasmic adaptor subunit [Dethiobacter alkaliphilus]|uniref:RND related barrel-sandwich hybrid domain-containing protein n=1 Tax=Dethiobacter alkaliphilus AHT 1 TaxID=555088 RepID=C0GFR7_DETAL|nr:HlyD family efflux transporter periplasmic adaptor subunit [Dethiobacter alkaliphilus]EEG77606.1 hypothetical protein DealDRAFT_1326 [Dethiobacter alkaliphilus AHT 1]